MHKTSKIPLSYTLMKTYINHPPPARMLSVSPLRVFATLVCAALFGSVLFVASSASAQTTPTSNIVFNGPSGLVVAKNRDRVVNALDYVSDGSYTITCGDATNIDTTEINTVTRTGCNFRVDPKNVEGPARFTVPYTSSGGDTHNGVINIRVGPDSSIALRNYDAGSTFFVPSGGRNTFNMRDYIYDTQGYSFSCVALTITSYISPNPNPNTDCTYTFNADTMATTGQFLEISFPVTPFGGTDVNLTIRIHTYGPASSVTYTPPTGLLTGPGHPIVINAQGYATDVRSAYRISCGDATNIDSTGIASVSRDGCMFTVTPTSVQGTTMFTVPYTSSATGTANGVVGLQVGPASNIVYNAPTGLSVALNRSLTIDAAAYVSDGGYTVSCGDATGFNIAELASVVRGSGANSCMFTVTPSRFQPGGTTLPVSRSFTVPYSSSGGDTHDGVINVMVNPSSTIAFTAPSPTPSVVVGGSVTLDLGAYVSDGNYTVSCGAVTVSAEVTLTSQNGCSVVLAGGASTGAATVTVPYTSTGGATSSNTVSVNVIAASSITFDAPTGLVVGTNRVRVIDASEYVTETDDSYTISCGNATSIDTTRIQSVTREGCVFTVTPVSMLSSSLQATAATFTVPYTSSGGDTENGTISIEVGPPSTILFTDPALFRATSPASFMIDASSYVSENSAYTVTCGAAVEFDSREVTSITQASAGSCSYTVTLTGTTGVSPFFITYTSTGGHSITRQVSMQVVTSSITYTAPSPAPAVPTSGSIEIDAAAFARDGRFTITCGTATSVNASLSVTNNGCVYTVTAGATANASASFTVPYTSSGGATANGVVPVNVGPSSSVSYTALTGLKVAAGATKTFDLSSAATDSGYTISCGAASSISASLTVSNTGCNFAVTAGSTQGTATFTVRFTSAGGSNVDGVVSVTIGAASVLAFSPPSGLVIGAGGTRHFDLSSYAADGDYAVECSEATSVASILAAATRGYIKSDYSFDAKGCQFEVTAQDTQGTGTFSVEVTSEATDTTVTATVSIAVGATSNIVFSGLPAAYPPTLPAEMPLIPKLDPGDCQRFAFGIAGIVSDCRTLVAIQNHWATPENRNVPLDHPLRTWGTSSRGINTWQGVTVGTHAGEGAVIGLHLSGLGIRGTIPPALGNLRDLRTLSLQRNYLTGAMPDSLNNLASVQVTSPQRLGSLVRFDYCFNYFRGALPALLSDARAGVRTPTFTANSLFAAGNIPCQLQGSPPADVARSSSYAYAQVGTGSERRVQAWITGLGLTSDYYDLRPIQYWDADSGEWANTTPQTCVAYFSPSQGAACIRFRETTLPAGSVISWVNGYYDSATLASLNLTNVSLATGSSAAVGQRGTTISFNAGQYASDGSYAITCTDYLEDDFFFTSVTQTGPGGCTFMMEIDPDADVTDRAQFLYYPYLDVTYDSAGGDTVDQSFYFFITEDSNIVYTPAQSLHTQTGRTITMDASVYSPFGANTRTCGSPIGFYDATKIQVLNQLGCDFTIGAIVGATTPATSFKILYHSNSGQIGVTEFTLAATATALTLTSPAGLTIAAGQTKQIDASQYAADGRYGITCGTPTGVDATKLTITQPDRANTCSYTITAGATAAAGATSFTVPYSSSGGDTGTGTVAMTIGPASRITYNAPTNLSRGVTEQIVIDAADYASDGNYVISCDNARNVPSGLQAVVRRGDCVFEIQLSGLQGIYQFTIPYVSSGGATLDATVRVTTGPPSRVSFTTPAAFTLGRNRTLVINALEHATEPNNHLRECSDPTEVDATKMAVTRDGCNYTVDPIDNLAPANQGSTSFKASFTAGTSTVEGTFTINIGPDSTITYVAPVGLERASNFPTYTIDASGYATEINPTNYTISCGDSTNYDTAEITMITRTANTCSYTLTLNGNQGAASFVVPYRSTGGDSVDATVNFNVGPASAIVFTAPQTNPAIGDSITRTFDMSSYASDGSYTITCGTIATTSSLVTLGAQNGCSIPITSGSTAGTAQISVPYTSSGGAALTSTISVDTAAASNIQFTAPSGLKVGINRTRTINAANYATDGGYAITCGTATGVDNTKLTSVTQGTGCSYTITPVSTLTASQQGAAAFTIPYSSAGGTTENGVFSIEVGPASTIMFNAPSPAPTVAKNRILTIDASAYATDGNYAITCGDAASIDTTEIQAVTHAGTSCTYTVYPKNVEGPATFQVPYMSEGGHTQSGTIALTVGSDSNLVFTAPTGLTVRTGQTLRINAQDHITENSPYTVTCADAASLTGLASATRTGCTYTVTAGRTPGTASFTVTYTSTSGATRNGVFTITVTGAPERPDTPERPQPVAAPAPAPETTRTPTEPADTATQSGWNTFTAQSSITAAAIRRNLNLSASQAIYTWDAETQAWTRITNPAQTITPGTSISFLSRGLTTEEIEAASLGRNTPQASLTNGWNIINIAGEVERAEDSDFLVDDALTDCDDLVGIIAIVSYNARTRRWSLYLPCHPRAEARLTTGEDVSYDRMTSLSEGDSTYIYTRSRIPLEITWNAETQTYQPAS